MTRHDWFDDPAPTFFSDLEEAALNGAFVATTSTPCHEVELARVSFVGVRLAFDCGRPRYREVELATFSIETHGLDRSSKRVTREVLVRDWTVLPEYCRSDAHFFWERANREAPAPTPVGRSKRSWFGAAPQVRSGEVSDYFEERQAYAAIQQYLVFSLSAQVENLQQRLEHAGSLAAATRL
jgi:hypothetical protein